MANCQNYYSAVKMDVADSTEMLVTICHITRGHVPEYSDVHSYRCEDLRSRTKTNFCLCTMKCNSCEVRCDVALVTHRAVVPFKRDGGYPA
jgi:hypothetical protein